MNRTIVPVIIFSLLIYPGIAKASSGGVPADVFKKTSKGAMVQKEEAFKKKLPLPKKVTPQRIKALSSDKERERKRKLVEKGKAALNNTEWEIEISLLSNKDKGKSIDRVIFQDNKVRFKKLTDKGFSSTNYSLTVYDDGRMLWETMQVSEKGQRVFIRGEVGSYKDTMKGVISYPKNDGSEKYFFKSVSKSKINP